jgi:hypothetical protein
MTSRERVQLEQHQRVVNFAENRGWKVLSKYSRLRDKMQFQCNQGHIVDMIVSNFIGGNGCRFCSSRDSSVASERLRRIVNERNAELIVPYRSAFEEVTVRCTNGHIFSTAASNITNGESWCNMCIGYGNEYTETVIRDIITRRGGTLMSEYTNRTTKITFKCDQNHVVSVWPHSILDGIQYVLKQILLQPKRHSF